MNRMKTYLQDKGFRFSNTEVLETTELLEIIDSLKGQLHHHLKSEPPAIAALARYNTAEKPIDTLRIADTAGKSI